MCVEKYSDNMTVWKTQKVIHIKCVDKNPMLTILINMLSIKLRQYDTKVECDMNSCVVRYIKNGDTLGILRFGYVLGWGKKVRQDIIILKEMDINKLIGDIMVNEKFTKDMGDALIQTIRTDATNIIRTKLSERE